MSQFRTLFLLSAAVVVGACSDTQSPSGPAESPAAPALSLQLDESVSATDLQGTEAAGGAQSAVAGKGKNTEFQAQTVSCVHNAWHRICVDIRNGVLRAARADAVVKTFKNRTNAQLRLDGVIIAKSGKFGPNFPGDDLFANYTRLNFRVFRGDRLCSQFPGATPQICAVVR